MINLTQSALSAISRFINSSETTIAGLRIQVSGGGCSGLQYSMKLEESAEETDQVLEFDGINILIDPESAPLMEGVELDFVDSLEGSGFKFVNPNAASSCACGQSFSTC
jgi:iron-sulfur cluster assembly protein